METPIITRLYFGLDRTRLDEPWPEDRDGNKASHLHSGKDAKHCLNPSILQPYIRNHIPQEESRLKRGTSQGTRGQEIPQGHTANEEHKHSNTWFSSLFIQNLESGREVSQGADRPGVYTYAGKNRLGI